MASSNGKCHVVFNGEIYNYIELARQLKLSSLRTKTDTEVLLEAYCLLGRNVLNELDGMFSFAILDKQKSQIFCARDPMSIKPFYYTLKRGFFAFASEPRAVLAGLGATGRIDRTRIAEFLVYGISDHDDGTSYEEVKQLQGGQTLTIDLRNFRMEIGDYYSIPSVQEIDEKSAVCAVRSALDISVARQLRSDVPVGTCLSGGLDSSAIIATVCKQRNETPSDFLSLTISNPGYEGDEAGKAKALADHFGITPILVPFDDSTLWSEILDLTRLHGEPYGGLSVLAQYKIMQAGSQHGLKVLLDGQGGDEIFLGYQRLLMRQIGSGLFTAPTETLKYLLEVKSNNSLGLSEVILGRIFFNSPRLAHFRNSRRIHRIIDTSLIAPARKEFGYRLFSGDVREVQLNELRSLILPRLLKYEDRNSMRFSIEARVPLLGAPLVDAVLSFPSQLLTLHGWSKYLLRMATTDRLPMSTVWQTRKRGFEVPDRKLIGIILPKLRERIGALPSSVPFNREALLKSLSSSGAYSDYIWRCAATALWITEFNVTNL